MKALSSPRALHMEDITRVVAILEGAMEAEATAMLSPEPVTISGNALEHIGVTQTLPPIELPSLDADIHEARTL